MFFAVNDCVNLFFGVMDSVLMSRIAFRYASVSNTTSSLSISLCKNVSHFVSYEKEWVRYYFCVRCCNFVCYCLRESVSLCLCETYLSRMLSIAKM